MQNPYRGRMLSFAHPELLILLAAMPLVAWWQGRRHGAALRFPGVESMRSLPRGRADVVRKATMILKVMIVGSFAIAAAGPRTPDLKTRLPSEGIAIVFVVDVSGSMATPDFGTPPTSRLDAAKATFKTFITQRVNDSLGLVAFAAWPRTECPPTLNHSVLLKVLDQVTPRSGVDAGTNIGDAIVEGLRRLQATNAKRKVLILLSDGEHNASGNNVNQPLTPRQAAQLAANLQIPVYAIDCGGDTEAATTFDAKQQRRDGRAVLSAVAKVTSGKLFIAGDTAQLAETLASIDALEHSTLESFQYRRYHDYGRWCGACAVTLLIVLMIFEATVWRRWPS